MDWKRRRQRSAVLFPPLSLRLWNVMSTLCLTASAAAAGGGRSAVSCAPLLFPVLSLRLLECDEPLPPSARTSSAPSPSALLPGNALPTPTESVFCRVENTPDCDATEHRRAGERASSRAARNFWSRFMCVPPVRLCPHHPGKRASRRVAEHATSVSTGRT